MAVSDTPWDFSEADYTPQQYKEAALIDTEDGEADSKSRYALPVKEPSGTLNRNGVHAAAGRLNQVKGISAAKRAAAAKKLVSLYKNELGEDPPEHLLTMASAGESGSRSIERVYISSFQGMRNGSRVEIRSAPGGATSRTIGGYAAVFGVESRNMGGFQEIVQPVFFNKSRSENWPDVICRYNHQDNYLLGTTRSGTLRVQTDNRGLVYDVDLPESRNDVLESVGRGDIVHSSFSFLTYEDQWRYGDNGLPVRMLVSGKLIDVSPVLTPAYSDATVGLRSLALAKQAPLEDVLALSEQNELRKLFIRTDVDGGAPVRTEPAATEPASAPEPEPAAQPVVEPEPLVEPAPEPEPVVEPEPEPAPPVEPEPTSEPETGKLYGAVELMKMKMRRPEPID